MSSCGPFNHEQNYGGGPAPVQPRPLYQKECPVDFSGGQGFGVQFPNTGSTVANLFREHQQAAQHLQACEVERDRCRLMLAKAEQAHKLATQHLGRVEGDLAAVVCGSGRAHVVGDFVVAPRYTGGSLLEAILSEGNPQVVIYRKGEPAP